jgi:hypothetical protein
MSSPGYKSVFRIACCVLRIAYCVLRKVKIRNTEYEVRNTRKAPNFGNRTLLLKRTRRPRRKGENPMKVEKIIQPLQPVLKTGQETSLETALAQDALYGESGYYVHTRLQVGELCRPGTGECDQKTGKCSVCLPPD